MPKEPPLQNLYQFLSKHPGASRDTIDAAHPTLPGRIIRHRLTLLELGGWIERCRGEAGVEEYWISR